MEWDQIANKVAPYIVKIETPECSGTGFLCFYNNDKTICGVATALHVVSRADEWQQPIKINHIHSGKKSFLRETNRYIYVNLVTDSAVILFHVGDLPLPSNLIPLLPVDTPITIGNEVGWFGFPRIEPFTLCFFSGNISAYRADRRAYLIDGVAINGVSGGPVVYSTGTVGVQVVGIVSEYIANRLGTDALPGLCIAQDVSFFHDVIQYEHSLEDAKKKENQVVQIPEE
ncbi:MAG: serine protease [Pseudomonadota bacterium]